MGLSYNWLLLRVCNSEIWTRIPVAPQKLKTKMDKNEVKKAVYKQKPKAFVRFIRKSVAYYDAILEDDTKITFEVPTEDMGDADFHNEMDAKLLLRWLSE